MNHAEEFAARVRAAAADLSAPPAPTRLSGRASRDESWREAVGPEVAEAMLHPESPMASDEPAWRETLREGGSLEGLLPAGMTGDRDVDRIVRRARLTEGGMPRVVAVPAWRECVGPETAASMLGRA
jgi:hypothetical protein